MLLQNANLFRAWLPMNHHKSLANERGFLAFWRFLSSMSRVSSLSSWLARIGKRVQRRGKFLLRKQIIWISNPD